jgi:Predicted membrane protein (DUF2142)
MASDVYGTRTGLAARFAVPLLVTVAYSFLLVAWIVGNPPGASPDEWAHYLRAVSISRGEFVGESAGPEGALTLVGSSPPPGFSEEAYRSYLRWNEQNIRRVHTPAGSTPAWFWCWDWAPDPATRHPSVSAKCINEPPTVEAPTEWVISTGVYQPLPYLAPALMSRIEVNPVDLTRLMRISTGLLCLVLLAAAIAVLWQPNVGLLALTGCLVAITPMAIFVASSLNPSGLEIASAIAFFAALLRLGREHGPTRWTWVVLGGAGSTLALSRTTGPLWIVLDLALFLALVGWGPAWGLLRQQRPWSTLAVGLVLIAVALNRVWDGLYGPHIPLDATPVSVGLTDGWRQLPRLLMEQVGVFNIGEFNMPSQAYTAWNALVVALIAIALLVGTRRERIILAASAAAALALPVLIIAIAWRHTGFGLQGRYVLPFTVVAPLLAGEVLVRRRERLQVLGAQRLYLPFATGAAAVQLVGWWADAHRFAVGVEGPRWFLNSAEWSPPAGWWPWFILATSGAILLVIVEPLERLIASLGSRGANLRGETSTADVSR